LRWRGLLLRRCRRHPWCGRLCDALDSIHPWRRLSVGWGGATSGIVGEVVGRVIEPAPLLVIIRQTVEVLDSFCSASRFAICCSAAVLIMDASTELSSP